MLDAQFSRSTRGAIHPERREPSGESPEWIKEGQVRVMVGVQMADEDVIN